MRARERTSPHCACVHIISAMMRASVFSNVTHATLSCRSRPHSIGCPGSTCSSEWQSELASFLWSFCVSLISLGFFLRSLPLPVDEESVALSPQLFRLLIQLAVAVAQRREQVRGDLRVVEADQAEPGFDGR